MTDNHPNEHAAGIQDLMQLAWQDSRFKQRLLQNPKAIIEQVLGVTLPHDINIFVHEDTEHEIHLVLPMRQNDMT